jgi:hypothetical protein
MNRLYKAVSRISPVLLLGFGIYNCFRDSSSLSLVTAGILIGLLIGDAVHKFIVWHIGRKYGYTRSWVKKS